MLKGKPLLATLFVMILAFWAVFYAFMKTNMDYRMEQERKAKYERKEPEPVEVPEYMIASQEEYIEQEKTCIRYEVYLYPYFPYKQIWLTDEELLAAFWEIIFDDGYYLHTVHFSSTPKYEDGTGNYSVATLKQINRGYAPDIDRSSSYKR